MQTIKNNKSSNYYLKVQETGENERGMAKSHHQIAPLSPQMA